LPWNVNRSDAADRYVSVPMTLSDLERRDTIVKFFRRISLITLYRFDLTTEFGRITHVGEKRIYRGQRRTYRKGAGSKRSPILGFPSIYAYTICRRTSKFDVVIHVGDVRVSWGQPRTPPIARQRSSPVFMATFFNAERPNSEW